MTLLDLALLICIAGGGSGVINGVFRRDINTAMLGLIVVAIAVCGLSR